MRAGIMLFVLSPLALVVHELGHLITARLLGVEVGGFGIGQGRTLWAGEAWGVPIRILAWPMSGRVYLGGFKLSGLKARIAFTTLMGPGANTLMVWATVHFWETAVGTWGVGVLMAWFYVNVLMAFSNLVPFQFNEGGVLYRSDGLALWRIVRNQFLASDYAVSALLMRAFACLDRRDYARAIQIGEAALERDPQSLGLHLMLAVCHHNRHNSPRALQLIEPLLSRTDLNALTRAGVLLARGRPHEALALLDYVHYDRSTPAESSGRAILCLSSPAAGGRRRSHARGRETSSPGKSRLVSAHGSGLTGGYRSTVIDFWRTPLNTTPSLSTAHT